MTTYRYTAVSKTGQRFSGLMQADAETEVIQALRLRGAMPIRAELSGSAWIGFWRTLGWARREPDAPRGLRKPDTATLIRELATMLTAGQDLDRTLRYMAETGPARARRTIEGLRDAVRDGSPLSAAMARYPGSFRAMHIGLVRAGEAGGNLGPTLTRLAELLDRQQALAATVTSALIYPTVLLAAMIGAVVLLLTQVLPQFAPMFEQSGVALPASTQFLISAGAWVRDDGPWFLILLLGVLLGGRIALRRPLVRRPVDRAMLEVPLIGGLTREVIAARFTRVLGTLLQNGVALIPALGIVRQAVGNQAAARATEQALLTARSGGALTTALKASRVFPDRTINLLRLGEETAQLAAMALKAADIHEERARLATQRLTALLVPALTVAMGVAVGGIVASLMTAMMSLNSLAAG